jgi:Queuosine salvage protein
VTLTDEVRSSCAHIAAQAEHVRIDLDAAAALAPAPGDWTAALDRKRHYLEGSPADVADYLLALDAINFGSGWFPLLRKRHADGQPISGYFTVAWNLADHARSHGPKALVPAWLRQVDTREIAVILDQSPDLELMSLYAQALRQLGRFLGERRALDLLGECERSAERLAQTLAHGMAMFADRPFFKRAQIVPHDLALAGLAEFDDLDRLTIFADNLVPHVLRCDGVLLYDDDLAARIDAGAILPLGGPEREIRACALHACELIAERTGVAPRTLDAWLWNRGQAPEYKARPRHRCRTVFY